jgi:hypothetical protein
LLTRDALDGRTRARKQFDAIASGIAQDLGGEDRLSTIQQNLIEAFAGMAVSMHDLNARVLLGQKVEVAELAQVCNGLTRIASRLGLERVAKDITPPSLQDYLQCRRPADVGPADD